VAAIDRISFVRFRGVNINIISKPRCRHRISIDLTIIIIDLTMLLLENVDTLSQSAQECVCKKGRNVGVCDRSSLKFSLISIYFYASCHSGRDLSRRSGETRDKPKSKCTLWILYKFEIPFAFSPSHATILIFFLPLPSPARVLVSFSLALLAKLIARLKTRRAVWREQS